MFSRRRRAASNPPPNRGVVTANPTAALAASQAFLKNANSNASLSSAAAAAALRSHQSSPAPVHTIQTKRMQRRASVASGASAATAPTMQRRMSNGSMSDRTFRSPSPARSSDNGVAADTDAPPVPAIPRDMSPMPKGKRAASADLPPMRVASPNPRKPGARPMSVDAGNRKPASNVPQRNRASTLSQVTEMDDSGSQKSINFSRPMSPRVTPTPPATPSPIKTSHSGWYTTPVVNDVKPREEIDTKTPFTGKKSASGTTGLETSIHNAANQPVKKRKKKVTSGGEGSHLAGGTMGAKPTGTAVDTTASTPNRPRTPSSTVAAPAVPDSPQSSELSDSSDSEGVISAKPAALVRQPSTVMEQPEAEEQAENRKVVNKAKKVRPKGTPAASRVAPAKAHVAEIQKAKDPVRSSKQSLVVGTDAATLRGAGRGTGHERQSSLSPGRQAHFVNGLVEPASGIKHQPPPRSVSPAKSALKHSPSSARTGSPIPLRMTQTPSDVGSDTGSERGPSQKRKKNVRVSFDDGAVADDESPSAQPTGLESSRWSGRTLRGEEEDLDEIMKPRPALPMFGSVRRERRDRVEEFPQKVTETVTPSMSNSVSTVVEPMEASTDQVVGGVLAENFASGKNNESTVAPEVAPTEAVNKASGADYSADEKEMDSLRKNDTDPVAKALEGENSRSVDVSEEKPDGSAYGDLMDVPSIAVQPATPGTEVETGELPFEIPGSWSGDEEPKSRKGAPSDGGPGPIEPGVTLEQYLESDGEEKDEEEEEEDGTDDNTDDGSVYSDAAESLVEGEEAGFASLNAIVESPSIGTTASPPESPEAAQTNKAGRGDQIRPPQNEANWDQAKSYWSGLNAQRKSGTEDMTRHEPFESENGRDLESEPALKEKKPKKKKKATVFVEPNNATSPAAARQMAPRQPPNQSAQPKKSALKSSMRAPRPAEPVEEARPVRMRASMRDAPPAREGSMRTTMRQGPAREGGMRSSMRSPPPSREGGMRTSMRSPPTGLAASRYSDTAMESREQKGALQKRNIPMSAQKPVPAPTRRSAANVVVPQQRMSATMPALGRTLSNDSDASVSSFKRARRPSAVNDEGRYSMRRSMRNSVSEAPTMRSRSPVKSPVPGASRSSRLSIRSLSPTSNLFGRRPLAAQNQDSSFPTLRSSQPPPAKSARFSMPAKSSKQSKPAKNTSTRFKSRFADSDDSDDDVPALPRFRSRFADSDDESDDEAMHANLRPVRGIPRAAGQEDGDSTDLEEEMEESGTSRPPTSGTAPPPPPPVPSSQDIERALPKGGLRDSKYAPKNDAATPRKEKRGFFGLGKKRQQQRPSTPTGTAPATASSSSPQTTNGKLQRRAASQPPAPNDHWPLTSLPPPVPPIPVDESEASEARPETSDGLGFRPKLAKRLSAAGGSERGVKSKEVLGRSGKKKKFGALRRVFGLTD
ncbi:uncharacterized protein K452DRAFT_300560 [Aplosporella prunicola CBS 121167]|uniref:Uncharacterized protein n=1 Tax=Aplosporella prunicola CBS 121167 TaxID=1176127 RepID=A0A6A6B6W9_9PEZI|nr:uncharacterized protein K452DRAFT_300560 [Aplosporella prunicola CBS 121167]KAF2138975.1 hypothetical protein K452DRAFT_300560 [Aplosporella prunicola CBS 121167]